MRMNLTRLTPAASVFAPPQMAGMMEPTDVGGYDAMGRVCSNPKS